MRTTSMRFALTVAVALYAPPAAIAQTAAINPTAPAAFTPDGTSRPISRATPSVTVRAAKSGSVPTAAKTKALPKAKALERAEKRKIDRDMSICKGC